MKKFIRLNWGNGTSVEDMQEFPFTYKDYADKKNHGLTELSDIRLVDHGNGVELYIGQNLLIDMTYCTMQDLSLAIRVYEARDYCKVTRKIITEEEELIWN